MENIDWNLIINLTQLILIIFVIFFIRDWRINWWNEEVSWRRLEIERYENLLYQQEILEKITQKLEIKQ
tara:strand:+ start:94 stop:300 length:207 start_codon:yes stop_codon:yes gene_type:complete